MTASHGGGRVRGEGVSDKAHKKGYHMSNVMGNFDLSGATGTADTKAGKKDAGVTSSKDNGSLVFDLTGVEEDKKFEVIPKGTYDAVVDELDFGDSKAGNPMVTVKYALTGGEFDKRVVFDYWVLQGKGAEFGQSKLKKFLVRVCPEVDLAHFNPKDFADKGVAIGKTLRVTLGIQTQKSGEYKGEKRNTIKDILAPESSSFLG